MNDFEHAKKYRTTLNELGMPKKVSWEDSLKNFYINDKYEGINYENKDIAEAFSQRGIPQYTFEKASELREEARNQKVPEHLLGSPLKEKSNIIDSIENIKSQTEEELKKSKEIIDDLIQNKFTYEWLSKNDPENAIIGILCSCCCTITNEAYGRYIARASITAKDVQNLVIRDNKGEIIAKGTFYLNKEVGYGVINDFEINEKYKKHEAFDGVYKEEIDPKEEKERELIFETFQRGVQAFVEKYDEKNPDNPIKQVNVGMGFNRLKKQVRKLKRSTLNLQVPLEYEFFDAREEQYVLYEKTGKENKKNDEEVSL